MLLGVGSSLSQQLLVERQRDIFHIHIIRVHSYTVKYFEARKFDTLGVENETFADDYIRNYGVQNTMISTATRKTLGPMLRMALPIALQMLLQTLINVVDTVMVGQLGEVEIGAIALGSQVYFLVVLFLFGVGSGAAVFASQYWGDRDVAGVRRSLGVSLVFGLAGSAAFALTVIFAPRALLSVFTTDLAVVRAGSGYLRTVVFGRLGTEYLAAYTISDTVGRLTLVLFIGTAQATQILIGNDVGAGRLDEAREKSRVLLRTIPMASTLVGLILLFPVAALVPQLFNISPTSRALLSQFLRLFALLVVVKVLNVHIITGILRGGADTRVALLIDVLPLWVVGVPLAFLLAFAIGVPPLFTYAAFFCEELLRVVVGIGRVKSGAWIHVLTGHVAK